MRALCQVAIICSVAVGVCLWQIDFWSMYVWIQCHPFFHLLTSSFMFACIMHMLLDWIRESWQMMNFLLLFQRLLCSQDVLQISWFINDALSVLRFTQSVFALRGSIPRGRNYSCVICFTFSAIKAERVILYMAWLWPATNQAKLIPCHPGIITDLNKVGLWNRPVLGPI